MKRLTVELIMGSPAFRNTLKERELDLRGHKVPRIENLGVTQDQFDTIDLSNNCIEIVEDFPVLKRLRTLIMNNNLVKLAKQSVSESLPNLESLILTNNRIASFKDISTFVQCKKLEHISLFLNPITTLPNYRAIMVKLFPNLKYLDFQKVSKQDRDDATNVLTE